MNESPRSITASPLLTAGYRRKWSTVSAVLFSGLIGLSASWLPASEVGLVGWGANEYGQAKAPPKVSGEVITAVAAGVHHNLAVKEDGTVVAWGRNFEGATEVPLGLTGVVAVAAGSSHSLALRDNGTVVKWGSTFSGVVPPGLSDVEAIAAGGAHSLALRGDGTVVVWGNNTFGQLNVPPGLEDVTAIAAGGGHTLALKVDGTVVAWGQNIYGQTNVPPGLTGVVAVAAGEFHSLALKDDGTVVGWGWNFYGQTNIPFGLGQVTAISAGGEHSLAVKDDGTVVAWGQNSSGQTTVPNDLTGVVAPDAGGAHNLALKDDGSLVAWGDNQYGQTDLPSGFAGVMAVAAGNIHTLALREDGTVVAWGSGTLEKTAVPAGLTDVVAISAGHTHNLALKDDGTVVAFGFNNYGQANVPPGLTGVVAVAAGSYHSLALKDDGTVVAWGYNDYGQTNVPPGLTGVVAVAGGEYHSLALKDDGTVVAWGQNVSGQTTVPVGLTGVTAIAAGGSHSLALKNDGTVVAWGSSQGQSNVPPGLTGVTAISAGSVQSLALKSDGTVVAWGPNFSGENNVPPGLTGVTAISAGYGYSLALAVVVPPIDSSPISLNTAPETGNIAQAWEEDERTFLAPGGARLTVAAGGGEAPPPSLDRVELRLLDEAGAVVASATSAGPGQAAVIQDVAIPAGGGAYRVRVLAQAGATGQYRIAAWDTASARPLVTNQQQLGSIESLNGVEHWTFPASLGRQLRLELVNSTDPGIAFTLRGPDGWTGFEEVDGYSDEAIVPEAGVCTLTAFSTGGASNLSYAFQLVDAAPTSLTVNTPYDGQFSSDGEARLFRLEIPNGGPLKLALENAGIGNRAEIYASRNVPPSRTRYEYAAASGPGANRTLSIPHASAGVWYVLLYADKIPVPGGYSLEARLSEIALTGISTSSQSGNVPAHLTLLGAGFRAGTVVELVSGTGEIYAAATVEVDAYDRLTASFSANIAPPGVYNVRATLPGGGGTATLPGAFTYLPDGSAQLETKLIMPAALGRHAVATIYVEYANTGTAPMPAPVLIVESGDPDGSDRPILSLDSDRVIQNFWSGTDGLPPGTANEVFFLASGAQPGMLNPGERFQVPVHYIGLLEPWDFNDSAVELEIRYWTEDDANPLDWTTRKEDLRPPTLDAPIWDAVYANLTSGLATTGQYVAMLNDNARYLGRLGLRVRDVSELWHFEMQQAYGHSVMPVLDSVADVAVVAPGLPLELTRTFSSNLRSRNVVGLFGQGWFTPWQTRLLVEHEGSVVKLVGEAGSVSTYSRDTRNNGYFSDAGDTSQLKAVGTVYELRQPDGSFTRYRADGFVDYVEDANGNRITATWSAGRLTALTHSSGGSLAISYDGNGRVSQIAASTGHSVTYNYGGDYLVSATTDDGKTTSYTYDTTGPSATRHALTSVTRGGVSRHFDWDARGRLSSTHLAEGQEAIAFAYGSAGSIAITQAAATTTVYFEHRGLLAKTLDPFGYVTTSEFDSSLRRKRLVLPSGESRRFTWCSCGSPATIVDELGRTTRFRYEHPLKKLTSLTDAKGNRTQYSYDAKGNLLQTTYEDASVESLANYTTSGLPQTRTNRRGQAITNTWTISGQLSRQTFADGSFDEFNYDARGNLVQVTEHPAVGPDRITSYTFTHATDGDRLKRVDYPDLRWVEYTYDTQGRRTLLIDSAGGETRYEYDTAGRLRRLRNAADVEMAGYLYDAAGRLSRIDKGNGAWTAFTYDAAGRILSLTNHAQNGTPESQFVHSYDARGRRTGATTQDGAWSYTYDATGQLIRAVFASTNLAIANQDLRYDYDDAGNRTSTEINGVATNYVPNEVNQYASVGGVSRSYDADGNLLSDGERTYQYDALSQLTQVVGPEGTTQYEYDAFGNRTATVLNGVRTEYLLDPTGSVDVVADFRGGNPVARNVHGMGLAARHLDGGGSLYFDIDAIGSVIATRGQDGAVLATQAYLPFGETLATSGAVVDNPFRFVGFFGVTSEASGLEFMRSRFYAPGSGKFANDDPIGLGGGDPNLTRYVANNPVSFIDIQGTSLFGFGAGIKNRNDGYADILDNMDTPGADIDSSGLNAANEQISSNAEDAGKDIKAIANLTAPGASKSALSRLGKAVFKLAREAWKRREKKNSSPRSPKSPSPPGGSAGARGGSGSAGSIDPNEKIGPGFGPEGWVPADSLLPYRINFENIGPGSKDENGDPYPIQATAPAQRVTITDDLEDDLDWDTFRVTDFGWGDTHITVPPDTSHHTETVMMTYDGKTFEVEVEAGIDYSTGRIFVVFQSMEAGTGLPPDVLTGFLPPEDGNGVGKGHFSYTIRTKASLATGTEIRNVAVIKFDGNETIATNQINPQDASQGTSPDKEALVTLDGDAPSATVSALPASSSSPDFTVSWGGSDTGSGIASYDLYVSVDGGPWELWLGGTSETSALFAGAVGRHYGFLAVARDLAGNAQTLGSTAQASTLVTDPLPGADIVRPTISITLPKPSGSYPASGRIMIQGTAGDNVALASWSYKLNRDRWRVGGSLSGTSGRWSKLVGKVKSGRNSVEVRAHDAAGLISDIGKRSFRLKKR